MFYVASLVFIFIGRLWCGSHRNVLDHIRSNYGEGKVQQFWKSYNVEKKLVKSQLDVEFLTTCKAYEIIPKFIRFRLHRKSLQSSNFYLSWQAKLLTLEINCKKNVYTKQRENYANVTRELNEGLRRLDVILLDRFREDIIRSFVEATKSTHFKKLENLGVQNRINPCDPSKVIFNFSKITIPPRVRHLLAFGLDFGLPVLKLDFCKFFLPIEKLAYDLKDRKPLTGDFDKFCHELKATTFRYFYNFKPFKIFSAVSTPNDIKLLKKFSGNSDIVISKPDKGRGVVIVNKSDYISSMTEIITNNAKFEEITDEIRGVIRSAEDRLNKFLLDLKKLHHISDNLYRKLRSTGAAPGILYGLPKIHKPDFSTKFQYRPIFAAYNSASYNLSNFWFQF